VKAGLAGVVLRCRDIEVMANFYENVLGFERFEPAPGAPFRGALRYRVNGLLFEIMPGGPDVQPPSDRHEVPVSAMVDVPDIQAAMGWFRDHGVTILTDPLQVPGTSSWVASILDPEGHHIIVAQH
jgi:predicted enzyme related to lactoylglutathione lyase